MVWCGGAMSVHLVQDLDLLLWTIIQCFWPSVSYLEKQGYLPYMLHAVVSKMKYILRWYTVVALLVPLEWFVNYFILKELMVYNSNHLCSCSPTFRSAGISFDLLCCIWLGGSASGCGLWVVLAMVWVWFWFTCTYCVVQAKGAAAIQGMLFSWRITRI